MKTSFVEFVSENDSFVYPCFDTNLSREQIITIILANPSSYCYRDLRDFHFRFFGPYQYNKARSVSYIYRIDYATLETSGIIDLVFVPKSESHFFK